MLMRSSRMAAAALMLAAAFTPGSEVLAGGRGRPVDTDVSSFNAEAWGLATDLQKLETCRKTYDPTAKTASGQPIKFLGMAIVYVAPGNAMGVFGHLAERLVFCRGNELFDILYDYSRPAKLTGPDADTRFREYIERTHQVRLYDYSDAELRNLEKSLFVSQVFQPPVRYAEYQSRQNRSVYETWLQVDEKTGYEVLKSNAKRWREQDLAIREHRPLAEYRLFKNNCTHPIRGDLLIVDPQAIQNDHPVVMTPAYAYRKLKRFEIGKTIVYPSQKSFRELEAKKKGKSLFLDSFAPLSRTARGNDPWVLVYPSPKTLLGKLITTPVSGAVNLASSAVQISVGILKTPIDALSRIPGLKILRPKKSGVATIGSGFRNLFQSTGELVWIRTRHPAATKWSVEEQEFFRGYAQNSAALEYLSGELK
jgi:hypothetical protein